MNDTYNVSATTFNTYLEKAKSLIKNVDMKSNKTSKKFGIKQHQLIDVRHILAIIHYTDETGYSHALNRSFWSSSVKSHSDLYWFGRYLYESVEYFGEVFEGDMEYKIYQGSTRMFKFDTFAPSINYPRSTTSSLAIAKQFSSVTGCVLEYRPKYSGMLNQTKFVDVSAMSKYKDEKERLFFGRGGALQINDIIVRKPKGIQGSLKNFISALSYLQKLLDQTIFDYNFYHSSDIYSYTTQITLFKFIQANEMIFKNSMSRYRIIEKYFYSTADEIDYVMYLFQEWCCKKTFATFESLPAEYVYMNEELKDFFLENSKTNVYKINIRNISQLLPNLTHFRDCQRRIIAVSKQGIDEYNKSMNMKQSGESEIANILSTATKHEIPSHIVDALQNIGFNFTHHKYKEEMMLLPIKQKLYKLDLKQIFKSNFQQFQLFMKKITSVFPQLSYNNWQVDPSCLFMDQMYSYLQKQHLKNSSLSKTSKYILDEQYDSDSIQMDIRCIGNIALNVDDKIAEAMVKFTKNNLYEKLKRTHLKITLIDRLHQDVFVQNENEIIDIIALELKDEIEISESEMQQTFGEFFRTSLEKFYVPISKMNQATMQDFIDVVAYINKSLQFELLNPNTTEKLCSYLFHKLFDDIERIRQWRCSNCYFVNRKLMIGALWRFYNQLSECALCGHRKDRRITNIKPLLSYKHEHTINKSTLPKNVLEIWETVKEIGCNITEEKTEITQQYFESCNVQDIVAILAEITDGINLENVGNKINETDVLQQLIIVSIHEAFKNDNTLSVKETKVLNYLNDCPEINIYTICAKSRKAFAEFGMNFGMNKGEAVKLFPLLQTNLIKMILRDTKDLIEEHLKKNNVDGMKFLRITKTDFIANLTLYVMDHLKPDKANEINMKTALNNSFKYLYDMIIKRRANCGAWRRIGVIFNHFHALTRTLTKKDDRYPYDIRLFLKSLPDYKLSTLAEDIDHILTHHKKHSDSQPYIKCEFYSDSQCVHLKRAARSSLDKLDLQEKQEFFHCDNFKDFVYISYLDRIHSQLLHSQINVTIKVSQDAETIHKYDKYPVYNSGLFIDYGYSSVPWYFNLKEELLFNTVCRINKGAFESRLKEAKQVYIQQQQKHYLRAKKTDPMYGITINDSMPMECVLAVSFYCNISELCTAFRASYRSNGENSDEQIQHHVRNFFWMGRFIYTAITFFGRKPDDTEEFYHGLDVRFLWDEFSAVLEAPTSTTITDSIAMSRFSDSGIGVVLTLAPKFKHELNTSQCLDVSHISLHEEDERLFAGMTTLAIIDIQSVFDGNWQSLRKYVAAFLYFEKIISQTKNQMIYYTDHADISKTKQKNYLFPLIEHQMTRNINRKKEIMLQQKYNDAQQYLHALFEHFCDSKREFINLSCIDYEKEKMDDSIKCILFRKTKVNNEFEYNEVNDKNIKLIFPNLKQYKNRMNYWTKLVSQEVNNYWSYVLQDCSVEQMIQLLTYKNNSDTDVQGVFAVVVDGNLKKGKTSALEKVNNWQQKIVDFFRENKLDGKSFTQQSVKVICENMMNYLMSPNELDEKGKRKNRKLRGGCNRVLYGLKRSNVGEILSANMH
eukprot:545200_1